MRMWMNVCMQVAASMWMCVCVCVCVVVMQVGDWRGGNLLCDVPSVWYRSSPRHRLLSMESDAIDWLVTVDESMFSRDFIYRSIFARGRLFLFGTYSSSSKSRVSSSLSFSLVPVWILVYCHKQSDLSVVFTTVFIVWVARICHTKSHKSLTQSLVENIFLLLTIANLSRSDHSVSYFWQ